MGNNGIAFDISDDQQFKTFVVQQFGILGERTQGLAELKKDVPVLQQEVKDIREQMKSDKFWGNVKAASGPVLVALHIAAKKIGINI
jgi:hypothetical protein